MSFGRPRLARAPFLFPKDRQGLLCVLAVAARGRASTCVRGHRGEPARPPARPGGNGQGASILSFLGIDRSHECNKERQRPFARLARPHTFARAQKHTRTKHQLQCGSRQQQQQCKASPSRHFPRISPRPAPFPPRASRASRESAVSGRPRLQRTRTAEKAARYRLYIYST